MMNELFNKLILEPEKYDFYQFCSILEWLNIDLTNSTLKSNSRKFQFCSWPYLGFPASELKGALPENVYDYKAEIVFTTFLGLIGTDGVMPNWMISDIAQKGSGIEHLTAFLDIFHHRIIILFYLIWKKLHFANQYTNACTDKISQFLLTLVSGQKKSNISPQNILGLIDNYYKNNKNLIGLKNIIKYLLPQAMDISIQQFVPVKHKITQQKLSTGILFRHAVLGNYIYDSCSKIKILLTINNYSLLQRLKNKGQYRKLLHDLIMKYIGFTLDIDLVIIISMKLLPQARLDCKNPRTLNSGVKVGATKKTTFCSISCGAL